MCAFVAALPGIAPASVIAITTGDEAFSFGLSGLRFSYAIDRPVEVDGLEVSLGDPCGSDVGGRVTIEAPLRHLSVARGPRGIPHSRYQYGPGTVSVSGRWTQPDCTDGVGTFAGRLDRLTIELCEQALAEEGACRDVFGDSRGELTARLGRGLFDTAFAGALGIEGHTGSGSFWMPIDGVSGGPSSPWRLAGAETGNGHLTLITAPVPEAGLPLLGAVACAAALWRQRAHQRQRATHAHGTSGTIVGRGGRNHAA